MKENKRCAFIKIKQPEESEEGHLRMNRRINENIFDAVKTSEGLEENPFGKLSSVPRKLKMFNNILDHKKLVNFHKYGLY